MNLHPSDLLELASVYGIPVHKFSRLMWVRRNGVTYWAVGAR